MVWITICDVCKYNLLSHLFFAISLLTIFSQPAPRFSLFYVALSFLKVLSHQTCQTERTRATLSHVSRIFPDVVIVVVVEDQYFGTPSSDAVPYRGPKNLCFPIRPPSGSQSVEKRLCEWFFVVVELNFCAKNFGRSSRVSLFCLLKRTVSDCKCVCMWKKSRKTAGGIEL